MTGHVKTRWMRCATALLALLCFTFVTSAKSVRAEETAEIEKLFREAVDLYQQGRYSESQRRLQSVLDKDLRQTLAARLVDEAGTPIMAKMMADVRMGAAPTRIWELYRKHYIGKLADKERMVKMAQRLVDQNTSEEERSLLYREFGELGHYAVPYLSPYLKDATHEDYRTYARIAIARMGGRAVLPTIALLRHSDQLMRENAILVLADIEPLDPRSLAALKAVIEDPKESAPAKNSASIVMKRITGLTDLTKPAAEYYYDLANRYYLDRPGVPEEAEDVDGMVWHLNAEGDLIALTYPLWAWNEQMAEENALRAMAVAPDFGSVYPLWACIQGAQHTEVNDLLDTINEQGDKTSFSKEEVATLEQWKVKLVNSRRLAAAVGKEHANAALGKVLNDLRRYPGHIRSASVGIFLARELAYLDPRGDLLSGPAAPAGDGKEPAKEAPKTAGGSWLVGGLDCADLSVQYACAISLSQIDRFPEGWTGSESVAKILGRGLAENKATQILLVEENLNAANESQKRLEELGYGVTTAASGRDAIAQAKSFPPKDILIISSTIRRDLTAEQLIEELRADVRTRLLPVSVLHPQKDRDAMGSRFGTDVPFIEREATGNDLKGLVEKAAEKRAAESVSKRKAHETSVACATALSKVDSRDTHIKLDDAVPFAIAALINRKDDVRIPAAIFLGNVEGGSQKDKAAEGLKAVVKDAGGASVELRRAALRSLGRVQKEGLEELYVEVQADADQEIKDIAAEAFGQISRANKSIADFVNKERIDKDAKEK